MKKIRTTNHKVTAALLVAVMMLSVIFTTVFTGGVKANATPTTHTYCYDENLLSNFLQLQVILQKELLQLMGHHIKRS